MEVTAQNQTERFLTFYLGDECYGVDIISVSEIIALMRTTKVPKSPNYLRGVMNLRGIIIPVVDMRTRFEMPLIEETMHTAIIIVRIAGSNIGFVVDRVEEVCIATGDQISEPPSFGLEIDANYIKKMIRLESGVVMVLDLNAIFNDDELSELAS